MPAARAAQEDAGLLPRPAELGDAQAGHGGQRLRQGLVAALLDLPAGQHGDGGGHPLLRVGMRVPVTTVSGTVDCCCCAVAAAGRTARPPRRAAVERRIGELRARVTTRPAPVARRGQAGVVLASGAAAARERPRRWVRCAGAPRPARARRLCAGRSPGSRVVARPRLLVVRAGARGPQWRVGPGSPPTVAGAAADSQPHRLFRPARRLRAFPFQPLRATGAWRACSRIRAPSPGPPRPSSRARPKSPWRGCSPRGSAPCRGRRRGCRAPPARAP